MQEKMKNTTDSLSTAELAELTAARELTDTDLTHVTGGFFKWGGGNGWGYGYGYGYGKCDGWRWGHWGWGHWGYGYGWGHCPIDGGDAAEA